MAKRYEGTKIFRAESTLNKAEKGISNKLFYFFNVKKFNLMAIFVFFAIFVLGCINLFTISPVHSFKQIFYLIGFIPIFLLIACLNPRYFIKLAPLAFAFSLLMLISIFAVGDVFMGARRWIDLKIIRFQPSEISKIITVLIIARYYHFLKESQAEYLKSALIPFAFIFSQVALVLKQPDLGTSLTITMIGVSVIFFAGLRFRYFIIAFLVCIFMIPVIWGKLHDYQKKRVMTFLNPEEDELGTGYNITQAKIAIGSGGCF